MSLDTHRIPMPELYKEECMNNDRRRIRDVFSRIDYRKDAKNIHLKDYLICPQIRKQIWSWEYIKEEIFKIECYYK